jgi:hypothetical protein
MNLVRVLALLAATLTFFPTFSQSPQVFAVEDDHFTLDGKPFKVLSGELTMRAFRVSTGMPVCAWPAP